MEMYQLSKDFYMETCNGEEAHVHICGEVIPGHPAHTENGIPTEAPTATEVTVTYLTVNNRQYTDAQCCDLFELTATEWQDQQEEELIEELNYVGEEDCYNCLPF